MISILNQFTLTDYITVIFKQNILFYSIFIFFISNFHEKLNQAASWVKILYFPPVTKRRPFCASFRSYGQNALIDPQQI